jgi:hypothetical protein
MLSKSPRYTVVMQQSKSKCSDHSPFTIALIARLAQPGVEGEAERRTLRCRTRPAHVFGIKFEVLTQNDPTFAVESNFRRPVI